VPNGGQSKKCPSVMLIIPLLADAVHVLMRGNGPNRVLVPLGLSADGAVSLFRLDRSQLPTWLPLTAPDLRRRNEFASPDRQPPSRPSFLSQRAFSISVLLDSIGDLVGDLVGDLYLGPCLTSVMASDSILADSGTTPELAALGSAERHLLLRLSVIIMPVDGANPSCSRGNAKIYPRVNPRNACKFHHSKTQVHKSRMSDDWGKYSMRLMILFSFPYAVPVFFTKRAFRPFGLLAS
jgi:hypothetical protein